jgi:hypothetical protein
MLPDFYSHVVGTVFILDLTTLSENSNMELAVMSALRAGERVFSVTHGEEGR